MRFDYSKPGPLPHALGSSSSVSPKLWNARCHPCPSGISISACVPIRCPSSGHSTPTGRLLPCYAASTWEHKHVHTVRTPGETGCSLLLMNRPKCATVPGSVARCTSGHLDTPHTSGFVGFVSLVSGLLKSPRPGLHDSRPDRMPVAHRIRDVWQDIMNMTGLHAECQAQVDRHFVACLIQMCHGINLA